jgi:glycosyltransferase involved in cell wall biosynthesis
MNPKVSVVIPTYNRAANIGKAIDSALSQTFRDLEVIVIDDGSSDNTSEVLREAYGDRIRYFAQHNQGASAARNKGLAEARGEWIALLDSDDFWEKEKLEQQFKALERFPQCGASYTDVRFLNYPETRTMFELAEDSFRHEGINGVNPEAAKVLMSPGGGGMVICTCALLARADLIAKSGGFDTNLRFGEDSEFMFRLALRTDFCYVNLPLVWIDRSPDEQRHVGASAEWNKTEFVLLQTKLRFEKFQQLSKNQPAEIQKLIVAGLAAMHSGLANCHLQAGEYGKARQEALKAVQTDFRFSLAVKWLLTWVSPSLALRAVQHHQQRTEDSTRFV